MRVLLDKHNEIETLNKRIEQQKIFFPAYKRFLNEISQQKNTQLPLPQADTLRREQISILTRLFDGLIRDSGLSMIRVTPDYASIPEEADSIAVKMVTEGDFFHLRKLFIGLGNVSYIRNLQSIRIQAIPKGIRSTLVFWIALDKTDHSG